MPVSYDVATPAKQVELGKLQQSTSGRANLAADFLRGQQEAFCGDTLEDARERAAIGSPWRLSPKAPSACPMVVARAAMTYEPAASPPPTPCLPRPYNPRRARSRPARPTCWVPVYPCTFQLHAEHPGAGGGRAHHCRGPS